MRVLLTGAAGYLGRLLLPALLADKRVKSVVTTDRLPLPEAPEHQRLDLAGADATQLDDLLRGIDCVIHLAFQMAARPNDRPGTSNNDAQARFLTIACALRRRVIVMSAAAAYGLAAGHDPVHGKLAESTPFAPHAPVAYAEQKQGLERLLDTLEAQAAGVCVVRARPSNVAGPHLPRDRAPQLAGPVMLAPATAHPLRQQLLHEADFASACLALLDAPAGAYNLAPDDWLTMEAAARQLGQRYVTLPAWMLRPLVDWAWRSGTSLFDASWLAFLEHPPVILDNGKLRSLGWVPHFTTADTLGATVAAWRTATGAAR